MPRFLVTAEVTVSAYTYVEAEDEAAARAIALNRDPHLCPYGPEQAGVAEDEEFVIEGADGMPMITDCQPTDDKPIDPDDAEHDPIADEED